jgi:hypothetical protein
MLALTLRELAIEARYLTLEKNHCAKNFFFLILPSCNLPKTSITLS